MLASAKGRRELGKMSSLDFFGPSLPNEQHVRQKKWNISAVKPSITG